MKESEIILEIIQTCVRGDGGHTGRYRRLWRGIQALKWLPAAQDHTTDIWRCSSVYISVRGHSWAATGSATCTALICTLPTSQNNSVLTAAPNWYMKQQHTLENDFSTERPEASLSSAHRTHIIPDDGGRDSLLNFANELGNQTASRHSSASALCGWTTCCRWQPLASLTLRPQAGGATDTAAAKKKNTSRCTAAAPRTTFTPSDAFTVLAHLNDAASLS